MNCSYYKESKKLPNSTKKVRSFYTFTPKPFSHENLYNYDVGNYYDFCNNFYNIYTTLPFTIKESGRSGNCTVLTHNGNEVLAPDSTSICAPTLKPNKIWSNSVVDSSTTTLEVISKTIVIEKVTTYKSTYTLSYSTTCYYCPTNKPLTTTTSTTITTTTTTTTTSSSAITTTTTSSSTPTSSSSITTSITSSPTIIDDDSDEQKCADKWAQCGGVGFTGPTCCKQGYHCHELNQYFSQCI